MINHTTADPLCQRCFGTGYTWRFSHMQRRSGAATADYCGTLVSCPCLKESTHAGTETQAESQVPNQTETLPEAPG